MAGIFISYRRSDSAAMCDRIYAALANHFGKDMVFKDVDNIPLGVNFSDYMRQTLEKSSVAVVIIGRAWLDTTDAQGQRRLDDQDDWVRLEIEQALALKLPVIPLRVDGAPMPSAASLPPSLTGLLTQNGWEIHYDPYFQTDMRHVTAGLERYLPSQQARQAAAQQAAYAQQQAAYQAIMATRPAVTLPIAPVFTVLRPPRLPKAPLPWRRINLYGGSAGFAAMALTVLEFLLLIFAPPLRAFLRGAAAADYIYLVVGLAGVVPAFLVRLRSNRFAAGMLAAIMAETIWILTLMLVVVPTSPNLMNSSVGVLVATILTGSAIFGLGVGGVCGVAGNWAAMLWPRVRPRRSTTAPAASGAS
jgi:hypothetical protein